MEIELLEEPKYNGEPIMLDRDGKRSVFCDIADGDVPFQQADGSDELDGPQEPSGVDIIAWAAASVSQRFGMSFNDALNRLAEVQEWIPVEKSQPERKP